MTSSFLIRETYRQIVSLLSSCICTRKSTRKIIATSFVRNFHRYFQFVSVIKNLCHLDWIVKLTKWILSRGSMHSTLGCNLHGTKGVEKIHFGIQLEGFPAAKATDIVPSGSPLYFLTLFSGFHLPFGCQGKRTALAHTGAVRGKTEWGSSGWKSLWKKKRKKKEQGLSIPDRFYRQAKF